MLSLLLVLAVWVALSVFPAAGFCLVFRGVRSHEELRRVGVPARRRAARDSEPALV